MKYFNVKVLLSSVLIAQLFIMQTASAEFGTLFTTASERTIIDDNRYAAKKVKKAKTVAKIEVEEDEPEAIIYKTIKKEYKISGISIANNGLDTAWINSKLHESGDILDKKVTIKINASERKIRFIVRGGKTYYGQSGDTVIVSYRVPLLD